MIDSPPNGRICVTCSVYKSLSEFSPSKTGKYGVACQCRDCKRMIERKRRYEKTGVAFGTYVRARPVTEFRTCTKCGQILSWDSFYMDRGDGKCKTCIHALGKAYRARMAARNVIEFPDFKICTKCKESKPSTEFFKCSSTKIGLMSICKSCHTARNLVYCAVNKDAVKKRSQEWRERNADWYRAGRKIYMKKWMQDTKERDKWKRRLKNNKRRDVINRGDVPEWAWKALLDLFGGVCLKCGSSDCITIDHIIPISKGGAHDISNVQPLCSVCNSRKNAKTWDGRPIKINSMDELSELLKGMSNASSCSSISSVS